MKITEKMIPLVTIIVIVIVTLWFFSPLILNYFINSPETRGQFGDSYGALNTLFSGLAFAGVVIAILLQRNELKLQREELRLTREELNASTEAQKMSGNHLGEQSQDMKVTAELNGLAALLQAETDLINFLKIERKTCSNQEIDRIMSKLEKLEKDRENNIEQLESLMHSVFSASETKY